MKQSFQVIYILTMREWTKALTNRQQSNNIHLKELPSTRKTGVYCDQKMLLRFEFLCPQVHLRTFSGHTPESESELSMTVFKKKKKRVSGLTLISNQILQKGTARTAAVLFPGLITFHCSLLMSQLSLSAHSPGSSGGLAVGQTASDSSIYIRGCLLCKDFQRLKKKIPSFSCVSMLQMFLQIRCYLVKSSFLLRPLASPPEGGKHQVLERGKLHSFNRKLCLPGSSAL